MYMKKRNLKENGFNIIGLWPNLARACEIALLGDFSIQVVFEKEYRQAFDDYEKIKMFYSKASFKSDGDLIVEIYRPDYEQFGRKYETLKDIESRVIKARSNELPDKYNGPACEALLRTATERLGLSLNDIDKVNSTAGVVAQLEGSKDIKPEHVAEAIQYIIKVRVNHPAYCNAENKIIMFGNGIAVANHELNHDDVQNAIEYLLSL
jgi:hypothetical protein